MLCTQRWRGRTEVIPGALTDGLSACAWNLGEQLVVVGLAKYQRIFTCTYCFPCSSSATQHTNEKSLARDQQDEHEAKGLRESLCTYTNSISDIGIGGPSIPGAWALARASGRTHSLILWQLEQKLV
jgi:hypothetical protein